MNIRQLFKLSRKAVENLLIVFVMWQHKHPRAYCTVLPLLPNKLCAGSEFLLKRVDSWLLTTEMNVLVISLLICRHSGYKKWGFSSVVFRCAVHNKLFMWTSNELPKLGEQAGGRYCAVSSHPGLKTSSNSVLNLARSDRKAFVRRNVIGKLWQQKNEVFCLIQAQSQVSYRAPGSPCCVRRNMLNKRSKYLLE